jgi:hypothetical protein
MGETALAGFIVMVVRRSKRSVVVAMWLGMAMRLGGMLTVAIGQAGKRVYRGRCPLQGQRQEYEKQSQLSPPELHERAQCKQNAETMQSAG